MTGKPSRKELLIGIAFFALMAVLSLAFLRPFDMAGWAGFAVSIAFVLLGLFGLWQGRSGKGLDTFVGRQSDGTVHADPDPLPNFDAVAGTPSVEERRAIERLLSALVDVEVLQPDEVDAELLWRAVQYFDPGEPVGTEEALGGLAALTDAGLFAARRMSFVPVHVEYERALLITVIGSILRILGHAIEDRDIALELSGTAPDIAAVARIPLGDRVETISFPYLWKDASPEIFPALARLTKSDAPRELICADPGLQMLVFLAVRPGGQDELNRRLAADQDIFGPV